LRTRAREQLARQAGFPGLIRRMLVFCWCIWGGEAFFKLFVLNFSSYICDVAYRQ